MLLRKNVNNDVSKDSPKTGVFGQQVRRQQIQFSNLSVSRWPDKKGYENKRSELRFQSFQGVWFASFSQHKRKSKGTQTGWKLSLKATKLIDVVQLERSSQSWTVICISMAKTTQYLNKYLHIFTSSIKLSTVSCLQKTVLPRTAITTLLKRLASGFSNIASVLKNLANNTFLTDFSVGLTFFALLAGRLTACDVIWLQQCSLNSKTRKEENTPSFNVNA